MASRSNSHLIIVDSNAKPHESHISKVSRTSSKIYRPYKYRFVITLLYCLVGIVNAIMWICTSPITTNLESIYTLDIFTVTFCTSLIWFCVYPPVNFIANYVLDEKGLQIGVFIGGGLTIIGLWIRNLNTYSFYYIFAGQLLGAIGQPFLLNAPQKLSAVWYPPKERALSTTIASVANPVGVGIGFLLAQNFVDDNATGVDGLNQVNDLMFFTALIGSVLILPSAFLFRKKPPTPPSRTADIDKYSYKESLKHLWQNKNYLVFILSTGLVWGAYNVLATALQPLVSPFNFSSSDSGNLGAITLISGLIGSVVWGLFLDRTKKYKLSLLCCTGLSLASLVAIGLLMQTENFALLAIATAVYGFFTTPVFPLSYEFCAELCFPVAEAASGGLMVVMTQIVGLGGTLGLDALLDNRQQDSNICIIIIGGLTILGLVGFIFTKEDLRRNQVEQEGELLLGPTESIHESQSQRKKSHTNGSQVHPSDSSGMRASLLVKNNA